MIKACYNVKTQHMHPINPNCHDQIVRHGLSTRLKHGGIVGYYGPRVNHAEFILKLVYVISACLISEVIS